MSDRHLCRRCNAPLVPGVALVPTGSVSPDFIGDAPYHSGDATGMVGTCSGMETRLAACLKCPKCGHSVCYVDGGPE